MIDLIGYDNVSTGDDIKQARNTSNADVDAIKAMSRAERDALKERINTTDPHHIFHSAGESRNPDKRKIICPICGNGSGEDATPVEAVRADNGVWLYNCFRDCGFSGDLLKIIANEDNLNLSDFTDMCKALAIGANLTGDFISEKPAVKHADKARKKKADAEELNLIKADIAQAQEHLDDLPESQRRGISVETYRHFGCGYLEKWLHPSFRVEGYKDYVPPPSRRLIIVAGEHYHACALPADRDGMKKEYWKQHAGSKELFGGEALRGDEQTILVVEGEYDAMSLWQASGGKIAVVAVLGVQGWKKTLLPLLNDCAGKKFVILFDGMDKSNAGRNGAENLRGELEKRRIPAVCKFFDDFMTNADKEKISGTIDANAILQTLGNEFLRDLTEKIIDAAQSDFTAQKEKNISGVGDMKLIYSSEKALSENFTADNETLAPMDDDAQIDSLNTELQEIAKALADFDAEKTVALETLSNVETFDNDSVFSNELLTAAAFARLFNGKAFNNFKIKIREYNEKHRDEKIYLRDWQASVNGKAGDLYLRHQNLVTRQNEIHAQIKSVKFAARHRDTLQDFSIPKKYSLTEHGIYKVVNEKMVPVCRRPVIITGKSYHVEDKILKYILAYMTAGKWKKLPETEAATVFDRRQLVKLANGGLPVTSSNANLIVDFLDEFNAENESNFPLTYTVARCGWHDFNGKDFFVDPRRQCVITDENRNISISVDSQSTFASSLKTKGDLETWKQAYQIAKKSSPVARFIVAAAVAPILLRILGERNFLLYIYAPTRAGKTTALYLAASAVGSEKMIRSFDATKNGLAGAAADVNDYAFLIDEKQVADGRLKEQFDALVYALANGLGRTKLNKDSTLRKMHDWRTIAIGTGETQLLADNVTGGANTRLLSFKAPKEILDADTCKHIRNICKDHYGHAFPLVVEKIFEIGFEKLRQIYRDIADEFTTRYPELLSEYCRYMAILTIADGLLNSALGKTCALEEAKRAAKIVFKLIPTVAETSDTAREKDFVFAFIAQNQNRFIGGNTRIDRMQMIYGKLDDINSGYVYISAKALQDACKNDGYDYRKLVDDLVADGFFIPADSIEKGRKTPLATVQKRLGDIMTRCYRVKTEDFNKGA